MFHGVNCDYMNEKELSTALTAKGWKQTTDGSWTKLRKPFLHTQAHTEETKLKIGTGVSAAWNNPNSYCNSQEAKDNRSKAQIKRCDREGEAQARSERRKLAMLKYGHPRGFSGHKRTNEEKAKISAAARAMWANPNHKVNSPEHRQILSDRFTKLKQQGKFSRCRRGLREDLGLYVRSSWEANYARYLNFLIRSGQILRWSYEPRTFWFEPIKRGVRSWMPDFEVTLPDGSIEYHEVKGWHYPRSKTALKRMKTYYPQIKIVLIDETRYRALSKTLSGLIQEWES